MVTISICELTNFLTNKKNLCTANCGDKVTTFFLKKLSFLLYECCLKIR